MHQITEDPEDTEDPPTITVDQLSSRLLRPELVAALNDPSFKFEMTGTVRLRVSLGLLVAVLIVLAVLIEKVSLLVRMVQ